jgi:hypothetical protein
MMEVDEETREQFRRIEDQFARIIDVVIETGTSADQKLNAFREEVREMNNRLLTAIDSMSKAKRPAPGVPLPQRCGLSPRSEARPAVAGDA